MARGQLAIAALKAYRGGEKTAANEKVLKENMKYFGYGYIKNADQTVPPIAVNFYAFRIMVGLGTLFIFVFAFILSLFTERTLHALVGYNYWALRSFLWLTLPAKAVGW